MRRDTRITSSQFSSSFLSCEKDIEEILKVLFVSSKPYSDQIKRLLVINTEEGIEKIKQEKQSALYTVFIEKTGNL